jgi:UDP-4-amino-4-deoxy-L-arabinose formyltransferase/UDP-glucuronic acid dehydrogenase (UDP-4-keto-hexauronic acid decarboxylating)
MGITGLDALKRCGFDIPAVFSHEDVAGENCWFGSVARWAKDNRIPVCLTHDVPAAEWIRKISGLKPDVLFSFYYRCLISAEVLRIPPAGAYNLHGSLLPAYRGRCPVNWVLVNGEETTGVTLHHMAEKADAGDIVAQKRVAIDVADTALKLHGKLCAAAEALLLETLPRIADGTAPRIPQDLSRGSYCGGRRPEDGRIDWHWPARRIYNLIRAVAEPYPGAFGFLPGGRKMMVWWGVPEKVAAGGGVPGTVALDGESVVVATGEGCLRLMDVEIDGVRMRRETLREYFGNREGVMIT